MASLLRLQALFSLTLATPRRLPSHLRCAAAVASPLPRRLPAAASNGSPEQRASETDLESGLYLVATPIGNLEDITLRALRVLKCAHVILSEDTRHSGKLLQHYNIKTPLLSFHKFNEREREPIILKRLHEGEAIAVISDAGTPGISDPGMELARLCATEKIPVIPIPGPSAAIAALSASGLPTEEFTFVGFLPKHGRSRKARLEVSAREAVTQIFYVPPHGIHQFLLDAASSFGDSRSCVIAREITKLHEEFWRGTLGEANEAFASRQPKGEITILIDGNSVSIDETPSDDFLEHELRELMAKGHALSTAVKLVAEATSAKKKDVYALALRVFGK
ncbi:ribosomal RNA small subunit methyltransferase I-like isoform X2 [Triticum dicoccoides]|uniref:Tetrapyrrole methylase domain-containing protein n=2 Tax=Triticum TaxID=4564 RepID=A0A9R0Q4D7_TRITD|nr:ribosomal RNA small subunit methyltransferase I-like isoform X2 [Triticum dicoccoides]XP_044321952.1 ribosomal RNA small subunit methyltransferase I-like isoform X2 [Triticum aestivum]VAH03687.1 unnamed protein product [Triticum turgidum subsp. durum]